MDKRRIHFLPLQAREDERSRELLAIVETKKIVAEDARIVLRRADADVFNAKYEYSSYIWEITKGDLIKRTDDGGGVFQVVAFQYLEQVGPDQKPWLWAVRRLGDGLYDKELTNIYADWKKASPEDING